MIYLDTSALVKLVVREQETDSLTRWLVGRPGESAVTSALGSVELMRTASRAGGPGLTERARGVIDLLDIIPISDRVIALAETIGPATLRSLDAIHLASAAQIRSELTAVVAYDHRLLEGCRALDYPTESPA
ncbi:type II toxin-antitoxin system VapC family toxin [Williamsia sp.]|uniref:type II toxin-antitoxin system VapC family toxin n=1 Tax=Williamsia sp. TaxID=1872085 RepID=UPI001A318571|nr:type II toxin-antitoxin system VapC family toxin [Williamsia sp.]MBJ7289469.1 type II toxin-antitoxin system VapC family toxin [Williamsia sp.]